MVSETRCCGVGCFHPKFGEALTKYQFLTRKQKVAAVAGTIFCGLLTLPFGGIGGGAFFRKFVESRKLYGMYDSVHDPLVHSGVTESIQLDLSLWSKPSWMDSVSSIMECYIGKMRYDGLYEIPRDDLVLEDLLEYFSEKFSKKIDYEEYYGFEEKRDLKKDSEVFVKADLHGDLRSLVETIYALRYNGYLHESYKLKENFYMVFLGDYLDRGQHGLEVLVLLARLKLENPDQVFLIKGNHEDVNMNRTYLEFDPHLKQFLDRQGSTRGADILNRFYQSMPLSVCISEDCGNIFGDSNPRQYVRFAHGAFEMQWDPTDLLEDPLDCTYRSIPRKLEFSPMVTQLQIDPAEDYFHILLQKRLEKSTGKQVDKNETRLIKQKMAAKRIQELVIHEPVRVGGLNWFQWGDIAMEGEFTMMGDMSERNCKVTPRDIKHCFNLYRKKHKIKLLYRGHEHEQRYSLVDGKLTVVTLPVAMELRMYKDMYPRQLDLGHLLTIAPKVKNWSKRILYRVPGASGSQLSDSQSIGSQIT